MAIQTATEQLFLELTNRARLDPAGEAARFGIDLNEGLAPGTISATSKEPLAMNDALLTSARAHSQDMIDRDYFAHNTPENVTPQQRATNAGYNFPVGENIAWSGTTGTVTEAMTIQMHQDLFVDAGIAGRGHRTNILGAYEELGAGHVLGQFTQGMSTYNATMLTEDFGVHSGTQFLTGVVFGDHHVADNFYTIGEGTASVGVAVTGGPSTTTGAAGGYSAEVTAGAKTITFTDGATTTVVTATVLAGTNAKVDVMDGTTIRTSASLTEVSGVSKIIGLGTIGLILTAAGGNDTILGTFGNDGITGGAGTDTAGFSGARSQYDIRTLADGTTHVTDQVGRDASDTLATIESLQFTDRTFKLASGDLNHISNVSQSRFDDVLFQNGTSGQVYYAKMVGGAFVSWGVDTGALGSTWKAIAAGDVNPGTTGGAETFVQNTTSGTIYYSSLDTGAVTWGVVSTSLTSDWKLRAVGDVNGNAGVDAIVQQASTGTIYYANMAGGTFSGWGVVSTNLTGDWVAAGAADINGDGFADVVVQQQSTGTTYWASMAGGAFSGWGVVTTNVTADWHVKAVADVNGDGFADVVMQSASTGTAYYANMLNGNFSGWGVVSQNTGAAWVVEGVADVDNDGFRDVLLQNTGNGTTYYADMGAAGFTGWGVVTTNVTSDWHVV